MDYGIDIGAMMQNRHTRLPTPAGARTMATTHARQATSPRNPVADETFVFYPVPDEAFADYPDSVEVFVDDPDPVEVFVDDPVPADARGGVSPHVAVRSQDSTSHSDDNAAPCLPSSLHHTRAFDEYMETVDDATAKRMGFSDNEENVDNRNNEEGGRSTTSVKRAKVCKDVTHCLAAHSVENAQGFAGFAKDDSNVNEDDTSRASTCEPSSKRAKLAQEDGRPLPLSLLTEKSHDNTRHKDSIDNQGDRDTGSVDVERVDVKAKPSNLGTDEVGTESNTDNTFAINRMQEKTVAKCRTLEDMTTEGDRSTVDVTKKEKTPIKQKTAEEKTQAVKVDGGTENVMMVQTVLVIAAVCVVAFIVIMIAALCIMLLATSVLLVAVCAVGVSHIAPHGEALSRRRIAVLLRQAHEFVLNYESARSNNNESSTKTRRARHSSPIA